MSELIDSFNVLWRFCAIVETIDTINIHQGTFMPGGINGMSANGRAQTMTHKNHIALDTILIQHLINGMGKEVERVFHMGLVALSIAWQVDKNKLQVFVITESLELLFPCVHVTTKSVNETDGLGIGLAIPYFIMYTNTIVNSDVLRLQFAESLRLAATTYQQQRE